MAMSTLQTPIICTVTGEGGSGGALAIGVGDHVMMLQYSTYAVISPEGCASILWKSAAKAPEAAEIMGITSERLEKLGLVDEVVPEPLGGAHRDVAAMAREIKRALLDSLGQLENMPVERLLGTRYERLMRFGAYQE
jgi:acetyl-CoA carboxylase carboxyl transferase subunit alpha